MSHQARECAKLIIFATVIHFFVMSSQGAHGAQSDEDAKVESCSSSLAFFPWGDPRYTDGGLNCYPRPAWVLAAFMDNGFWVTNDSWYGWQPSLGDWHLS